MNKCGAILTSLVSQTSAPSAYMTRSFWLPLPGAKRIFFTQPRCVGIPLKTFTFYCISLSFNNSSWFQYLIHWFHHHHQTMVINVKMLPGQTCFEVPEVEITVYIPKNQGVPFPGNAGDAAHTALQHKGRQVEVCFIYQNTIMHL